MACELIELGAAMACELSLQNTAGAASDPMAGAANEVAAGGLDGEVVVIALPPTNPAPLPFAVPPDARAVRQQLKRP